MVFGMAKKETPALDRDMMNVLNATYQTRNAAARMWNVADSCPLFLQKKSGISKKKKKAATGFRSNRVLRSHTMKALASGAAAEAARNAKAEAAMLRCDIVAETTKYPLMPSIGKGAGMLIETALVAYLQEAFSASIELKNCMKKHKKVTQKCAQAGIDAVNERIAMGTSFVPAVVVAKVPLGKAIAATNARKREATKKKALKYVSRHPQEEEEAAAQEE